MSVLIYNNVSKLFVYFYLLLVYIGGLYFTVNNYVCEPTVNKILLISCFININIHENRKNIAIFHIFIHKLVWALTSIIATVSVSIIILASAYLCA